VIGDVEKVFGETGAIMVIYVSESLVHVKYNFGFPAQEQFAFQQPKNLSSQLMPKRPCEKR
jgi:hypothetical protein